MSAKALRALETELERIPPRPDGLISAVDFFAALAAAIERTENEEWEARMGEDL